MQKTTETLHIMTKEERRAWEEEQLAPQKHLMETEDSGGPRGRPLDPKLAPNEKLSRRNVWEIWGAGIVNTRGTLTPNHIFKMRTKDAALARRMREIFGGTVLTADAVSWWQLSSQKRIAAMLKIVVPYLTKARRRELNAEEYAYGN